MAPASNLGETEEAGAQEGGSKGSWNNGEAGQATEVTHSNMAGQIQAPRSKRQTSYGYKLWHPGQRSQRSSSSLPVSSNLVLSRNHLLFIRVPLE
jgi:hypothetical protein